jgi:hypothetical protein
MSRFADLEKQENIMLKKFMVQINLEYSQFANKIMK